MLQFVSGYFYNPTIYYFIKLGFINGKGAMREPIVFCNTKVIT